MATTKKLIQAAAGVSTGAGGGAGGGGGGGGGGAVVQDFFSSNEYTGNGTTTTITNDVDLTSGGMVIHKRTTENINFFFGNSVSGGTKEYAFFAGAEDSTGIISSFNSDGYTVTGNLGANQNNVLYNSYSFANQDHFFKVFEYTGNGTTQEIAHGLGCVPGLLFIKASGYHWGYWHNEFLGTSKWGYANLANAPGTSVNVFGNNTTQVDPTSTNFTVGSSGQVNGNGVTYTVYAFGHNTSGSGGFGGGSDDVIKCGKYTGNGSTDGPEIDLGFVPQLFMFKNISSANDWFLFDSTQGLTDVDENDPYFKLKAQNQQTNSDVVQLTASGIKITGSNHSNWNATGNEYVYMAIRKPMTIAPAAGGGGASGWTATISDASYDSVSMSVSAEGGTPHSFAFNSDGTKIYCLITNNDRVYQYPLSTAYDISSAGSSSANFLVEDQVPVGLAFSTDGTKMYVVGFSTWVRQYSLSTAFDLSTASYDNVYFGVGSQDTDPQDIIFNTAGTKMYMTGAQNDSVFQYSLSTAFDISTASYDSVSFSASSQDTSARSIAFNTDGTKMYLVGATNDSVFQYSLSTAFNVGTASYDSVSFSVSSQDTDPRDIRFNPAGTKMYIAGDSTDTIYQYSTNLGGSGAAFDSEDVFSTDIYTGNGGARIINNGIDLDGEGGLIWIKARNAAYSSVLFDTNRGFGNYILSDQPLKQNFAGSLGWTGGTFNTNGFTLPNDSNGSINGSFNYVSWTFRNASTFFDSLTYNSSSGNVTNFGSAGATVDHSLGSVPDLIIAKCIDTSSTNWRVYHSGLNGGTNPEEYEIYLNLTSAEVQSSGTWYDTAPTSTQFTLGYANNINGDVNTVSSSYLAYLFASVDGISKVGSYTGNGTSQTIDCGFTAGARWILVKRTDSTGDWYVWDTERGVVAANDPHLSFNASVAEVTSDDSIDPANSGFIVNQVSPTNINVSTAKYIFMAIA